MTRGRFAILAGVLALGVFLLRHYSIKGPVYERAVIYKEFDTELSPPAMYIGPSFTAILQLLAESDPDEIRLLVSRYREREANFRRQYAVWMQRLPEGDVKRMLESEVHAPAVEFYRALGGKAVARSSERFGDKSLDKVAFAWNS